MSDRVIVLLTLKASARREDYEEWVRSADYPVAKSQPGVIDYVVTRLDRDMEGAKRPSAQYLEFITVEDGERYQAEMSDQFKNHLEKWAEFVETYTAAVGTPL